MTIDERSRHALHSKLRAALGDDAAATLMEHLPPVGWADVATKRDLDMALTGFEERMNLRFDVLEHRLRADFRGELNSAITAQTRTFMFTVMGSNLTIAGIAFAAAALR